MPNCYVLEALFTLQRSNTVAQSSTGVARTSKEPSVSTAWQITQRHSLQVSELRAHLKVGNQLAGVFAEGAMVGDVAA